MRSFVFDREAVMARRARATAARTGDDTWLRTPSPSPARAVDD